jgi:hypothetical protein
MPMTVMTTMKMATVTSFNQKGIRQPYPTREGRGSGALALTEDPNGG